MHQQVPPVPDISPSRPMVPTLPAAFTVSSSFALALPLAMCQECTWHPHASPTEFRTSDVIGHISHLTWVSGQGLEHVSSLNFRVKHLILLSCFLPSFLRSFLSSSSSTFFAVVSDFCDESACYEYGYLSLDFCWVQGLRLCSHFSWIFPRAT